MTRYFLRNIKIEGFRGINNETDPLELRFRSDAVNSVFSANGGGKSSIFEALCYAIRKSVPKLDELLEQERPQDYVCNLFHSQGVATVELEFQPDDTTPGPIKVIVIRDANGLRSVTSPSGHPNPEALLTSLDEDFTLLNYPRFARFIDSTPLERGRSFSALVGLSSYSDFRQALQAVADTRATNTDLELNALRAEAEATQEAVQLALRRLTASYEGLAGQPLTDVSRIDECAAEVVSALGGIELIRPHVSGKHLNQIEFDIVKEAIRSAEGGDKRRELEHTVSTIGELEGLGEADGDAVLSEQAEIRRLVQEKDTLLAATRGDLFRRLYDAAKAVIDSADWSEPNMCPLCESDLDAPIADLVRSQIDHFGQVAEKAGEVKDAWRTASWVRRLAILEGAGVLGVPIESRLATALKQRGDAGELMLEEVERAISALTDLEAQRADLLASTSARREELEKELPPSLVSLTEQIEYGRQFRDAFEEYKEKTADQQDMGIKIGIRERWRDFISKTLQEFATAETSLSQSKIAAIDAEYKAMFARITAVNDVVPDLRRAEQREALHVELSDFHGESGVSARALLPESYRNALAISVFLSAAAKQTSAPRFVVLDDVTSSFDAGHQWNLMEFIRTSLQFPRNPDGMQFIVLSHDGLLEKYLDTLGNTPEWHHQRLQGWPPMGSVVSQTQDTNRLRSTAARLLSAGQVREAEPMIRQYLEFKLLQIISKVRIPVPLDFAIKDHMKMVSNALNAIREAIDLHRRAGSLVLDATQVSDIDNTYVPALVGNWVSHYETASGTSLSPPMLLGVLQTIDAFAECFQFDDTSGGSTQRRWYKSLSTRA